jgi:nucleoside 2-deoxyribosyltransferase
MTISQKDIKVTLIGSFKRDQQKLTELFELLRERYTLLSPASIDWIDGSENFVRADKDKSLSIKEIENRHLDAIRNSDFVILHAPEGYVGLSGAFELGFANALGIPVISKEPLADAMLSQVIPVNNNLQQDEE